MQSPASFGIPYVSDHALVAQLDRASDFESEGWEFDPLRVHHFCVAKIALEASFDTQKGEHRASVCRERRAHPKFFDIKLITF